MRDELLAPGILGLRRRGEKLYEILRLGRGLGPGFRRGCQKKPLQLFLASSQGRLIGLKLVQALAAHFGRLLGGHAAALVEVDRVVGHGLLPFVELARRLRTWPLSIPSRP